jgi:hypothetical protein
MRRHGRESYGDGDRDVGRGNAGFILKGVKGLEAIKPRSLFT